MPIAYTCDELLGLCSHDLKPVRAVRKSIFRHQLWQPAFERKQTWWKTRRTTTNNGVSSPSVHQRERRSAVKFGLLNAQSVGNSWSAIATTVNEGQYDVFLLTETWHTSHEDVALRRCAPPGYTYQHVTRKLRGRQLTPAGRITAASRPLYQTSWITDDCRRRSVLLPSKQQQSQ